jgi:hypothetical protein
MVKVVVGEGHGRSTMRLERAGGGFVTEATTTVAVAGTASSPTAAATPRRRWTFTVLSNLSEASYQQTTPT